VFDSEDEVRALRPSITNLMALDLDLIVTAPGKASDFVSRVFAPHEDLPEDPVCGSAHCTMIPFWSERLERKELYALQVSDRGGELKCRALGDHVEIAGRCTTTMIGTLEA
jgi:predicted PhzF superfamily epimerase YddE/YHI9